LRALFALAGEPVAPREQPGLPVRWRGDFRGRFAFNLMKKLSESAACSPVCGNSETIELAIAAQTGLRSMPRIASA